MGTAQALAANGGHIVAQKTIYGGSYNLLAHTLPQYGIKTTFVNAHDLSEVENAIVDDTRAIYLETLSLRLDRHSENIRKVIEFLSNHPKVAKVNHPSLPDYPDHALYEKYFPNGGASGSGNR